ncbi:hypothetical protein T10_1884 [Trichinella papuae]|uniref:Uncharacterized protein n=1 Tax=Trichinella papuae TaxID=268474 RepID=A0A0V1MDI2_9BILA|nr:hypothetical protein T10_1884 [Trichinella papuae]
MGRFETPLGGTKPLHRWSSAWTAETTILTRSRLVDFLLIDFLPEIMHAHQFNSFVQLVILYSVKEPRKKDLV